jgi:hypothetical protein
MNRRTENATEQTESCMNAKYKYKITGQCGIGRILRLQGQCHESSQDIAGSYYALKGHSASSLGELS